MNKGNVLLVFVCGFGWVRLVLWMLLFVGVNVGGRFDVLMELMCWFSVCLCDGYEVCYCCNFDDFGYCDVLMCGMCLDVLNVVCYLCGLFFDEVVDVLCEIGCVLEGSVLSSNWIILKCVWVVMSCLWFIDDMMYDCVFLLWVLCFVGVLLILYLMVNVCL